MLYVTINKSQRPFRCHATNYVIYIIDVIGSSIAIKEIHLC